MSIFDRFFNHINNRDNKRVASCNECQITDPSELKSGDAVRMVNSSNKWIVIVNPAIDSTLERNANYIEMLLEGYNSRSTLSYDELKRDFIKFAESPVTLGDTSYVGPLTESSQTGEYYDKYVQRPGSGIDSNKTQLKRTMEPSDREIIETNMDEGLGSKKLVKRDMGDRYAYYVDDLKHFDNDLAVKATDLGIDYVDAELFAEAYINYKREVVKAIDVSKQKGTVSNVFQEHVDDAMKIKDLEDLKNYMVKLVDEATIASDIYRAKTKMTIMKSEGLLNLQHYFFNVILSGAGESVVRLK